MKRIREAEWMDSPGVNPEELRKALTYIRRVNKYLGYNRATRNRVCEWSKTWTPGETIQILDVATGSGDVPIDLQKWADKNGKQIEVVGLDFHGETTQAASEAGLTVVQGDAMNLPFENNTFDYVLTSMFLHHLSEEDAVRVLSEMWRVAKRGVLAADLLREKAAIVGIWCLTRLSSKMIRHDAMVSVRQAFTFDEIGSMCERAGWEQLNMQRHPNSRFTAIGSKR